MIRIFLSEAAIDDVDRLFRFLEKVDPGTAVNAGIVIDDAIRQLGKNPEFYPVIDGEYRIMTVPFGKRGYSIAYRFDSIAGIALVLGVKHQLEEFFPFELTFPHETENNE